MALGISESYRKIDEPGSKERVDVRKEAEKMSRRYETRISELRKQALSSEAFREASLKATEQFKKDLKSFLTKNGAEDLYDELVGFTSGHVAEIVQSKKEGST